MSLLPILRQSQAALAGFAAIGVGWGAFAAAIPDLKAALQISESQLGLALFCAAAGAVLSMASSAWIMDRVGFGRRVIAVIVALLALAFTGPSFATGLAGIALAMACVGLTTGLLDVIINARVSQLEARLKRHLMSLSHGTFSLAYAISALTTGALREAGFAPSDIYPVAACAIGLLAVVAVTAPRMPDGPDLVDAAQDAAPKRLPAAVFLIGVFIMIAFFGENATEIWSALHVEQTLGGGAAQGAMGPALLGLTMALGRFSGQALSSRFSLQSMMLASALLAGTGGFVAAIAPTPMVAYIGFALLGLGVSTLAPLGFALGGRYLTDRTRSRGMARMTLVGYMGFFLGPPIMGLIAEAFGLRVTFGVIGAAMLTLPLLLRLLSAPPASQDTLSAQPGHTS